MNKILSFATILGAALTFVACSPNEEDDIFDQSAAERLNAASELYSSRLTAQPNGWVMQLYPTLKDEYPYGNGYIVLMRFANDHTVKVGMNNVFTNNTYAEDSSHWDVITDDGPVLSFDTYNKVFHLFSDPYDLPFTGSKDVPNNEQGKGAEGDYEYIIVDAPEDASYMMLKGKKRATYNLLTPMEEGVDYKSYLQDVTSFQSKMFPAGYSIPDYLVVGDSVYNFTDAGQGLPNIYPVGTDAVINQDFNPFLITKLGNDYYLRFRDSKTYGDKTVQRFKYDASQDKFISVADEQCYIEGNHPDSVFYAHLTTRASVSRYTPTLLASDSYKSIISTIDTEFKKVNKNYYVRSVSIRNLAGSYVLSIDYSGKTPTTYIDYNLDMAQTDKGVKFSYTGAEKTAQNILNRVPSIKTLIDAICASEMKISGGETSFDLRYIRLTSTSDQNFWFVMNIN